MPAPLVIARRVGHALATLLFVMTFNFFLFRVMPGDPISMFVRSQRLTSADVARLRAFYGLDQSLGAQYVAYLKHTAVGNFGTSLATGQTVWSEISARLWPTILLVGTGTILATVFGVIVGTRGAWRRGRAFDTTTLYGSLSLWSMPEGWLGMLLLLVLAGTYAIFPAGGYTSGNLAGVDHYVDILNHLVLPCLTLALSYVGQYVVVMRSSMIEVMNEPFVLTARAKGVPDRLVRRNHAAPNAFLPTFTLIFLNLGFVIGGAIVIETVFSWPGIGLLTYHAISSLDYPVLAAVFFLGSAAIVAANLVADLAYGVLDPRVRRG